MISVILLLQMHASFFIRFIVGLRHLFDIYLELSTQLLFGDTADCAVIIPHADILQIVQLTEDAHLAELADTCQKHKTQIRITFFKRTKKVAHNITDFFLCRIIIITIQHRRIVFIYQDNDLLPRLFISTADNTFKTEAESGVSFFMTIYLFP